jgi:hypothetical protein
MSSTRSSNRGKKARTSSVVDMTVRGVKALLSVSFTNNRQKQNGVRVANNARLQMAIANLIHAHDLPFCLSESLRMMQILCLT